jgi:hypothetical protein
MAKEAINFADPIEEPKPVKAAPKAPVEQGRGTNLLNTALQGVAGVTDVATSFPHLLGNLLPAAVGSAYESATTDKSFMDSWDEHQQLPFMKGAAGMTTAARKAVNDFLGIPEPKLLEDQAVRIATSTFIPGVGLLSNLATSPSKIAAAGRMLTPVMKVTKSPTGSYLTGGNVLRGGAQIGMGGTIDQAVRANFPHPDHPTMWSEQALSGKKTPEAINFADPPSDPNSINFADPTAIDAPVSAAQNKGPKSNTVNQLIAAKEENDREQQADTYKNIALITAGVFGSVAAKRVLTNRAQILADKAGPLGSSSPDIRGVDKALLQVAEANGAWGKTKTGLGIVGRYLHTDWTDAAQHNIAMLRSKGVPEDVIQVLAQSASTDWKSVAKTFHHTGELGQGSGIKTHAPRQLELDRLELNSTDPVVQVGPNKWLTQRELFDLSELARTEQTNRTMAIANDVINRSKHYRGSVDESVGITPEASAFLNTAELGMPGTITNNLRRIAQENGIAITRNMTPQDVVDALRAKVTSTNPTAIIPELEDALAKSDLERITRIFEQNPDAISAFRRTPTDVDLERYPNMQLKDGSVKLFDEVQEIPVGLRKKIGEESLIWGAGDRLSDDMLSNIVKAADADDAVSALSRKVSKTLDDLLDYRVHMKELDIDDAKALRRRFTIGVKDNARLAYIPMINNQGRIGFWERLANLAGIRTRKAEELAYAKELEQRGINFAAGTDHPVLPLSALTRYADNTIEGVNHNTYQHQSLMHWAEMRHGKVGDDAHAMVYTTTDDTGKIVKLSGTKNARTISKARDEDTTTPQYLGYKPFDTTNDSLGDWVGFKGIHENAATRAFKDVDPDVVWTMQHGRLHAWKVPDAGQRASLDLHPALTPGQHFFRHWNNVFKAGTTGPLSAFAPVAHIFSAQQIAANVVGRSNKTHLSAVGEGAKSFVEGLKGTWDLLKGGWARDRADYLSQRIADQISRGEMPSAAKLQLRDRLEAAYANSFMLRAQKETGRTAGYMGGDTRGFMDSFNENEANFVRHVGVDQANLLWRMWKSWNHAWHEGPAFAQLAKYYGANIRKGMSAKDEARLLREAADFSKQVAGDMRKVGASESAKWFNAAVPFAPAMIQSWASIGGAIRANPTKFLTGITSLIAAPTAAEMMWNFSMSGEEFEDENGRKWTHNEYFWKGFNAQQRASTNIVMIPNKPPWEAHQFPVSPEWSLIRGFVLDSLDAILNLSGTRGFDDLQPAQWNSVAGLNRVLDVAMPPPMAAAFTAITGKSVRGGFSFDPHGADEEGEGGDISITTAMPIGTGGRYATRSQEDGAMDKMWAEIIQDIAGSGGKLSVDIWNAATAGLKDRYDGAGIGLAAQRGAEAFGLGVAQQLKFPSSIFGRTNKLSTMQPTAKRMHRIKENIKVLQDMKRLLTTAGKGNLQGIFRGTGLTNMMNDNAVWNEVAASVSGLNKELQQGNKRISFLRKDSNSLGMDGTKTVSLKRRMLDANNAELNDIYDSQYAAVKNWEKKFSEFLKRKYKDDSISIDLEGSIPHSRLEGKSLLGRLRSP